MTTPDPIIRLNAALEGRYHLESELGEGGMATVYLADDLKHERKVALKVLKPDLAAVVGAERFLAEIKTTANLQHPHILPLFDSGEADSFLFYVMPHVEGETLREKIDKEKQLPVDEALGIATSVANALQTAHDAGVVHRDIKPGNILLSRGQPLVADFGIALAVGSAGSNRLTETGLSLGTPYYMSPEQATGDQHVGPASDTYALAAMLYEMLTGDPPYIGSTAQAVLGKIIQGAPVSATEVRRSVPRNVDAALRKALEKLPADRFANALDFAAALANPEFRYGESAALGGAPGGEGWGRLTRTLAATTALFALAFGWALLRPQAPDVTGRYVLGGEGWEGRSAPIGRRMAVAPDGSSMILPFDGQLAIKMRNSTELTPIPGTEDAWDVVYSPEGDWIAYALDGELFKRPTVGGAATRLAQGVDGPSTAAVSALDWLDDGTILYEPADGVDRSIVQIPSDGGDPTIVVSAEDALTPVWVRGLPGGKRALLGACPGQATQSCYPARSALYFVDVEAGTHVLLLEQVVRGWYSPTGHLVYVRADGELFAQPFDADAGEMKGGALPLGVAVRLTNGWADIRVARDGTLLYVEGALNSEVSTLVAGERSVEEVYLDGRREVLPLAPRVFTNNVGPSWSSDGRSIAYASEGHIYTYDVVRNTRPRQVTFEGLNVNPLFSPDGSRVVFSSLREGTDFYDLVVKDLTNDTPPRLMLSLELGQAARSWPTDSLLVFEHGAGGGLADLWVMNPSTPEQPTPEPYMTSEYDLGRPAISPSLQWAAYSSDETGTDEVYIRSFPVAGERTVVSQGGGDFPYWSPGGDAVYYLTPAPDRSIVRVSVELGPVPVLLSLDTLFTIPGLAGPAPMMHRDGDRFIFSIPAGDDPSTLPDASGRLILVENFFAELRDLGSN